jgi:hypothetical protein
MRLISLEIPEADATRYQNRVRQNPKPTRSRATKSRLGPKCQKISQEGGLREQAGATAARIGAGKSVRGTSLLVSGSFGLAIYSGGTVVTWARPLASYVLRNALLRFVVMSQSY